LRETLPDKISAFKPYSGNTMKQCISVAHWIDRFNDRFADIAKWAVLLSCGISALNAFIRYIFAYSSNAWLEIQWYLFAACVMLGAAQVLRVNEHVRVDVIYGNLKSRTRVYIDLFGLCFFLMPVMILFVYLAFPFFWNAFASKEMSGSAGGLIRWPVMILLPLGFSLVILQGFSEIVKRIGWLSHSYEMDIHYERPLQ